MTTTFTAGYPDGVGAPVVSCAKAARIIITAKEAGLGKPVPKAVVTLKIPGLGIDESGTTDDDGVGHFDVTNVPDGSYPFTVSARDPDLALTFVNDRFTKRVEPDKVIATVVECGYPYVLRMHLDADRDGTIDDEPTDHTDWTFGEDGRGAILVPCTREYEDEQNVEERCEVQFRWTGKAVETWQECTCTLTVDHPERIKAYADRKGSDALDASAPIELLATKLTGNDGRIHVWLEAADFPTTTNDADALVMLTFTFRPPRGGDECTQHARLRIAPWIMSGDLDRTRVVYARGVDDPGPKPPPFEPRKVQEWQRARQFRALTVALDQGINTTFTTINVSPATNPKGFMRDVIKCGYTCGPHASRVVVLGDLDRGSPIEGVQTALLRDYANTGHIRRPVDLQSSDQTGQDNGGNYLVTPPREGYPYGRIIYGDNGTGLCHAGPFFAAQRIQGPIELDSTWLDVGHVDEFLSLVPDYGGHANARKPFKVLIASPRLAYLLLWASARQLHYSRDTRLEVALLNAIGKNHELVARPESYADMKRGFQQRDTRFAVMGSSLESPDHDVPTLLHYTEDYEASPAPPDDDGKLVYWTNEGHFGRAFARLWPDKRRSSLRLTNDGGTSRIRERNLPRECFIELRKDIAQYLEVTDGSWSYLFDTIQPKIDAARATLKDELGLEDTDFIEVPTLMQLSADNKVYFETPDSVNLLALNDAGGPSCTCIIPKPFGPVIGGEFVFETYLREMLSPLGLTLRFVNDLPFSLNHGEIHCGTNQLPHAMNPAQWWHHELPV